MRKPVILLSLAFCLALNIQVAAQTPLLPRDSSITSPQTFAMIMGVSNYKYIRPLQYADKDAELFRDYLKSPGGGSVPANNIFCLLNENAINANFWSKGFQWLRAKQLQKGDRLFIYLAGHGDAIDEDQFFFLSYDCNPAGDKNNYLVGGTIQLFNLKKKIAAETAKGVEVFFIMDACRSNELPGGLPGQNFLNSAVSEKRAGEIIMLATGAGQASLEDASIGTGHGLFTYYLVDGLNGMADQPSKADQQISFAEIEEYVSKNVPSVAQQRFKRNQQPYFCCNENSDKIISSVDTVWLRNWMKNRQRLSGGNSFNGIVKKRWFADTTLLETYNRFYEAIRNNQLVGRVSAEDYFNQLAKKFPANPYTLDAKTSLAAAFIKQAQAKVDNYLTCTRLNNAQKQENYEAGMQLEKAMNLLQDEDPDYAATLESRMRLLKTNNADGAFTNAYAALRIDPNGAYILNRLAMLHLDAHNRDSALYYAQKATSIAPGWNCAATTLALVQQSKEGNNNDPKKGNKKPLSKSSYGVLLGGGVTVSQPSFAGPNQANIENMQNQSGGAFDFGLLYFTNIAQRFSIRPALAINFEKLNTGFQRRPLPGGELITETVKNDLVSFSASLPVVFRLSANSTTPYLMGGASFNYLLTKNDPADPIQLKNTMLSADAGLGVDIAPSNAGIIISPELSYSFGRSDIKESAASNIDGAFNSLKKNNFRFTIYLRKR